MPIRVINRCTIQSAIIVKAEMADSKDSEFLRVHWESSESWEYGEIPGLQRESREYDENLRSTRCRCMKYTGNMNLSHT